MRQPILGYCPLICIALAIGCGGPAVDPNRPATVAVSGKVTRNGQPVEGATVTLLPKTSGGRGASGRTDTSGAFALTTFDPGDGAIPGSYLVTVSKTEIEGNSEIQEDPNAPPPVHKDLLPTRYKDPSQSGLTAEIKEGDPNQLAFDLTD